MSVPQYIIDQKAKEFDESLEKARLHRNYHRFGSRHGYSPEDCPECHGHPDGFKLLAKKYRPLVRDSRPEPRWKR